MTANLSEISTKINQHPARLRRALKNPHESPHLRSNLFTPLLREPMQSLPRNTPSHPRLVVPARM
jgi:hypothetical protein